MNGGKHMTDVTNASRTMLMNIHSLEWDRELCRYVRQCYWKKGAKPEEKGFIRIEEQAGFSQCQSFD